mmetsp:Transcript_37865/g.61050  ORF Transcript_37865/g.61050 Transcript_37865/m.61050 type:complete len:82 (-) Transcript_37865:67-312(-)
MSHVTHINESYPLAPTELRREQFLGLQIESIDSQCALAAVLLYKALIQEALSKKCCSGIKFLSCFIISELLHMVCMNRVVS